MEDLKGLLKKKKGEPLPENYKKAKMGVLKEISDMAGNDMGEGIKGIKKVTVAAPDKAGLEKGLDLAKHLAAKGPMGVDEDADKATEMDEESKEDPKEEAGESAEEEASEESAEKVLEDTINHECSEGQLDNESIDELIKLLQSKKKSSY